MNKIDGTGKTSPIIKSSKPEKVVKNDHHLHVSSGDMHRERSLEEIIIQYLNDVEVDDEDGVIAAYVKGSLVWQMGQEILSDVDYPNLYDGIMEKIQKSKAMRESILQSVSEINHG